MKSLAIQVALPEQRLGAPELVTVAAPAKAGVVAVAAAAPLL